MVSSAIVKSPTGFFLTTWDAFRCLKVLFTAYISIRREIYSPKNTLRKVIANHRKETH